MHKRGGTVINDRNSGAQRVETGVCLGLDKISLHAAVFFSSQCKSRRPRKPTSQRRDLREESETPVTKDSEILITVMNNSPDNPEKTYQEPARAVEEDRVMSRVLELQELSESKQNDVAMEQKVLQCI